MIDGWSIAANVMVSFLKRRGGSDPAQRYNSEGACAAALGNGGNDRFYEEVSRSEAETKKGGSVVVTSSVSFWKEATLPR